MPLTIMRFGIFLMIAGFFSFFFHHIAIISGIVSGLGYAFTVIGIIGWSLEESGDVSFN